jgi:hypothetical protein
MAQHGLVSICGKQTKKDVTGSGRFGRYVRPRLNQSAKAGTSRKVKLDTIMASLLKGIYSF